MNLTLKANDRKWLDLVPIQKMEFIDWLEAETGLSENDVHSVTLGEGFVICEVFLRNEEGKHFFYPATNDLACVTLRRPVKTMPPFWPTEGGDHAIPQRQATAMDVCEQT